MAVPETSLTLALDLSALRRLRDPADAVADARTWTTNLGIVAAADLPTITKFTRDNDLDPDFTSGPGGVTAGTLEDTMATYDTDRYVYVGTTDDHEALAASAGWEYQPIVEAAAAAEWRLQYATPDRTTTVEDQRDDWP